MTLTPEELQFLRSQDLDAKDVFDCGGRSIASCRDQAKSEGKTVLLHGRCNRGGHRLKTRYGHCVQCDTSKLAYQARSTIGGFVYVMYSKSKKLTKIGFSTNIDVRLNKMRYDEVGGVTDWQLLFYVNSRSAGRIEQLVHQGLALRNVQLPYFKDGRQQLSRECFACRPIEAVNEIVKCVKASKFSMASYWKNEGFGWDI